MNVGVCHIVLVYSKAAAKFDYNPSSNADWPTHHPLNFLLKDAETHIQTVTIHSINL